MQKSNQKLGALSEIWSNARGRHALPRWSAFDVRALRPWLGNLALIECLDEHNPVFRLCGTNLHDRFGGEFTRRSLSALDRETGASLRLRLEQVLQSKAPIWAHFDALVAGMPVRFSDLFLPLSDDDICVNLVLFASYPRPHKVMS